MDEQQEQPEVSRDEQGAAAPVNVVEVALWMIQEMQAHAWVKMGLWKDPITNDLHEDLPQAKIAIDCVAALFGVIQAHLSEAQRREMERLLTDLRLNFVQRSVEATPST